MFPLLCLGIVLNFDDKTPSDQRRRTPKSTRAKVKVTPSPAAEKKEGDKIEDAVANDDDDGDEDGEPATCGKGHEHPGRMYADTAINLSVDALFTCLFTDSQFFADFCAHRGTFDVKQARWPPKPWPTPEKGEATFHRKISYTLTLKQRLGPRTCTAMENQVRVFSIYLW